MHRRRIAVVLLTLLALLAATAASAHAILLDSTPKTNGSLAAGHAQLALRYNSRIDQARSRLVLVDDGRHETALRIADDPSHPSELRTEADLKPGTYTLHWQALALDGHITRGDLPFTVTAAP